MYYHVSAVVGAVLRLSQRLCGLLALKLSRLACSAHRPMIKRDYIDEKHDM